MYTRNVENEVIDFERDIEDVIVSRLNHSLGRWPDREDWEMVITTFLEVIAPCHVYCAERTVKFAKRMVKYLKKARLEDDEQLVELTKWLEENNLSS